jgi:hypothetical protein
MLLFRDEEHVDRWCSQWRQTRGATLTLEQAWRLGRVWYGEKMSVEWRRATVKEAEELFASLGLVGEFWSLCGLTPAAG